jgi:hypothetical protein
VIGSVLNRAVRIASTLSIVAAVVFLQLLAD